MNVPIRNISYGVATLLMASMVSMPVCTAAETACGKSMTAEQIAQRSLDMLEIQNVADAHEYYHGVWDHTDEINNIWSKRDDISWKNNTDYYIGRKDTWRFYVENAKTLTKTGVLAYHMLTTPIIEVAGDGQTAKGIWMSFGNVTGKMGPTASAMWTEEKYGIDFIKENGEWKIWHLRTYVEFYSPADKSWLTDNINAPRNTGQDEAKGGAGTPPQGQGGNNAGAPPQGAGASQGQDGKNQAGVKEEPGSKFTSDLAAPTEKGNYYVGYTLTRDPIFDPKPPTKFCHFSETTPFN